MFYVLKSSDVLDVLVPILYFLNDARSDQCKNTNSVFLWILTRDSCSKFQFYGRFIFPDFSVV